MIFRSPFPPDPSNPLHVVPTPGIFLSLEIPPALFLAGLFRSSNQVLHFEWPQPLSARGKVTPAVRNTWAAGAIVVGAIKIYHQTLPTRDRHELNLRCHLPLMDDKIRALGYTSTVRDGFPLQHKTRHVYSSKAPYPCVILYSPYMLLRMQRFEERKI